VHLVGFIIRIYHDARSSECQIRSIMPRIVSNYAVDYKASHSRDDETLATALPEPQNSVTSGETHTFVNVLKAVRH